MLIFPLIEFLAEVEGHFILRLLTSTFFRSGPDAIGLLMLREIDHPLACHVVLEDLEMDVRVIPDFRLLLSLAKMKAKRVLPIYLENHNIGWSLNQALGLGLRNKFSERAFELDGLVAGSALSIFELVVS